MMDKTFLFTVESEDTARGLLRSDFLSLIKKEFKKIVILVPRAKLNYYKNKYERENVVVDLMEEEKNSEMIRKFFLLLKYSISTKEAKLALMRNLFGPYGIRFSSWWIFFWPILFSWYLSRYKFWRNFLRKIYGLLSPDKKCLNILQKYKPDIVYVAYSSVYAKDFNLKLLKAAKKLNILTLGYITSWDQFYSKIFITQHTDFLIVHNQLIKKNAIELGDFKEDRIRVVGVPHFDFYSKKELLLPREVFFRQIGADPNKKLIVFGGGLRNIGENFEHFFDFFNHISTRVLKNVQFYLRPHPKHYFDKKLIDKFRDNPNLIFEKGAENPIRRTLELTEKDDQFLFNLLYHANILICSFSTLLIEASFLDRPVINLGYSGNPRYHYYFKSERNFEREHLEHIFRENFAKIAKNDEELLECIKIYLENPTLDREARKRVAKEQMFLTNGKSAATLVAEIVDIAKKYVQ